MISPKHIVIPIISIIGLIWTIRVIIESAPDENPLPPSIPPLSSPNSTHTNTTVVAGTGLIESASEEISVGSHLQGIVHRVMVKEGDHIEKGTALFILDTRQAKADVAVAKSHITTAQAELKKAKTLYDFYNNVANKDAIIKEELSQRALNVTIAKARLAEAETHLEKARTMLALHTVKSPISGKVLEVIIKPGTFVTQNGKLMRIGDTSRLHARINIDAFDIGKLHKKSTAILSPKGNADIKLHATFLRVKPYIIPKNTLSGSPQELVDTRVLQAIFRLNDTSPPVFTGQQVDAYIESDIHSPLITDKKQNTNP